MFATLFTLLMASTTAAFSPLMAGTRATTELAARRPFITGNWKLNPQSREEAVILAKDIAASIGPDSPDAEVALFVPYVFIEAAMGAVGNKLGVGAEVRCRRRCRPSLSPAIYSETSGC
jgi:triosephosphate isomerase (TIM)